MWISVVTLRAGTASAQYCSSCALGHRCQSEGIGDRRRFSSSAAKHSQPAPMSEVSTDRCPERTRRSSRPRRSLCKGAAIRERRSLTRRSSRRGTTSHVCHSVPRESLNTRYAIVLRAPVQFGSCCRVGRAVFAVLSAGPVPAIPRAQRKIHPGDCFSSWKSAARAVQ